MGLMAFNEGLKIESFMVCWVSWKVQRVILLKPNKIEHQRWQKKKAHYLCGPQSRGGVAQPG